MVDKIELTPRVRDALIRTPEGAKILLEMQQKNGGIIDTIGGGIKNVWNTLWNHKLKIIAGLSLGNSSGLFKKLAPQMGRLNMGWLAEGADAAGGWISKYGRMGFDALKNLWDNPYWKGAFGAVDTAHGAVVNTAKLGVNMIPGVPPPAPPTP